MVFHQHASGIGTRQGHGQRWNRVVGHREITVGIRCTEHALFRSHIAGIAPRTGFLVLGFLEGDSGLQLPDVAPSQLTFHRQSVYRGSFLIATFNYQHPVFHAQVGQGKHVRKVGIETFHQQVALPVAPAMVHIGREAQALRFLFLQVIGQFDHRHVSTHVGNVQVLVEGLRRTETERIAGTQVDVLGRIIAQVHTRAEYRMVQQVVLVQTAADEETPLVVFPFVLGEGTHDAHLLVRIPLVAPHVVLQIVLVVFQTGGQVGRHEEATVKMETVLCSGNPSQVGRRAVGIQVLSASVVAVPFDVLGRSIHTQAMFLVG